MRIVTGHATDSRIVAVPATIHNSIWFITKVVHASLLRHQQSLFETDVASATNILRQLIALQFGRIKDLQTLAAGFNRRDMLLAWAMTALTSNQIGRASCRERVQIS